MNIDWFNVRDESLDEWKGICPVGEFRLTTPDDLPGPLPARLTKKFDSVLVTAEQHDNGIFYVANGHRLDRKDYAVDQNPFGLVFQDMTPAPSGCLIQHGNWQGRTTHPPLSFWDAVHHREYPHHHRFAELPDVEAGPLEALHVQSQLAARRIVVQELYDFLARCSANDERDDGHNSREY